MGVSIKIETALAELQNANQDIKFKKLIAKDLEDIFLNLKPDQILALGFDVDSTNALRIASESLARLEADLDRDNGAFVLRVLETHKDIISGLQNEPLLLDYEILECRAFVQLERVREAKQKYENLCRRYPNDPRAFLYLAQIHLDNENFEINDELLKQAETLDGNHWLLRLEKLIRQYRLGNQIDGASIDEQSFPTVPRIKSNFYRLYALFLERAGDKARADSFIERAIHLNPDKINNYHAKLSILEIRCFSQPVDNETLRKRAEELLREIEAVQQITDRWGKLSPRNQATLNLKKLNVAATQENLPEMEKLAEESIYLIMQCHFDQSIDQMLVGFLRFGELPPEDFKRLLHYLQGTAKVISDNLARTIALQFILKKTLFTEGKQFFGAAKKKGILHFIDNLENAKYDEVWMFLKEDLQFAVTMAIIPTNPPDLRRKIIDNLPNDGSVQRDKLLFLLNYEERNINEAFDLLKGFDLSKLNYFEYKPILDIAREKKAWEVVTEVLETLLRREKDRQVILRLKFELFAANLDLGRFSEAIQIGERILREEQEMSLLNQQHKEDLLRNTLVARMKRGEYPQAKTLLEKHPGLNNTFEFKVAIEAEIYLRNNEVWGKMTFVDTKVEVKY